MHFCAFSVLQTLDEATDTCSNQDVLHISRAPPADDCNMFLVALDIQKQKTAVRDDDDLKPTLESVRLRYLTYKKKERLMWRSICPSMSVSVAVFQIVRPIL
jgi:hypothetical protein